MWYKINFKAERKCFKNQCFTFPRIVSIRVFKSTTYPCIYPVQTNCIWLADKWSESMV